MLVRVCLKSFEICRINNDLRCMQYGGVFGVTEVSLVKELVSCCKRHAAIWLIYGLFMHKEVMIVDIRNSSF